MKKFLITATAVLSLIGSVSPAFAADFSTVVGVDKELRIVERVTNKSIFVDIQRVQSYRVTTTDASGAIVTRTETNETGVIHNSDVVIGICQAVQQINFLPTDGCGVQTTGRTRREPTAHKSN